MAPVLHAGGESMCERYIRPVAAGEMHIAFGVTEPDAGTDTTAIDTTARRDGSQWLIRGRKVWTSKATLSQKVLLLARTSPRDSERPTDGMTLFVADLQRPEVEITPIPKIGRNAVSSCEVVYDDLPVADEDVVGEVGKGFRYLLHGLNAERILLASEAIGLGRAALARATAYAKERVVFGRPIGQNQGVAFPLAQSEIELQAARLMVAHAARLYDAGEPCGAEANGAKWFAAEAGFNAADRAMQTHGGYAYATEYDVGRWWTEARLVRLAPISQEMILNHIASHVLGLPRSY
jgi:acyl-CoA dehydrogenase